MSNGLTLLHAACVNGLQLGLRACLGGGVRSCRAHDCRHHAGRVSPHQARRHVVWRATRSGACRAVGCDRSRVAGTRRCRRDRPARTDRCPREQRRHRSPLRTGMPLSDLQVRVASIVLAVPEAAGFALAGGAALIFYEVTDRATRDLDCFGPTPDAVNGLYQAAVAALEANGLHAETQQRGAGFARLNVTSGPDAGRRARRGHDRGPGCRSCCPAP